MLKISRLKAEFELKFHDRKASSSSSVMAIFDKSSVNWPI